MKELLKAGQSVEVWDDGYLVKHIEYFIGFTSNGKIVTEVDGVVCSWDNYRVPKKKVKYNVWHNMSNNTYEVLAETSRLLGYWEVVSTFEISE
jgi:hypothetical protein